MEEADTHFLLALSTKRQSLFASFWSLQLLGWSGYFVAMAFSRLGRFPLAYMFAEKGLLSVLGVTVSLGLRFVLRRQLRVAHNIGTVVLVCVIASYVLAAAWTAVANVLTVPIEQAFLGRSGTYQSIGALFGGTVYNSFALVAWGFLYLGIKHHERASRAELMVAEVRLHALQYQLNPHLFFNTLNAVSTLIVERKNDDAALMIARLGDFLRSTLRSDLASEHPLADELSLANQYLEIEQVRFGERLKVVCEIEEEAYRGRVPLMLLQPLVENAARHGIARLEAGGRVVISAQVVDRELRMSVENDAPDIVGTSDGGLAIGLDNVRKRLAMLYDGRASLHAGRLPSGVYRVDIGIPFTIAPAG